MDQDGWNRLYLDDDPDKGTGTEKLFLAVAGDLDEGRALDLGCGSGRLALALAEVG